jgi:hypothetical protein
METPLSLDDLENLMSDLRAKARAAAAAEEAPDTVDRVLRQLRAAQADWEQALAAQLGDRRPRPGLTVPERAHAVLALLDAPAGPKLISATHEAFFGAAIPARQLGPLRRDQQRSYTTQSGARPYYICAALTGQALRPARGLLALSTWTVEQRLITPHAPRVDAARHAERVAERLQSPTGAGAEPAATRALLRLLAAGIPGAWDGLGEVDPARLLDAARDETSRHTKKAAAERRAAAKRARAQLTTAELLFGATHPEES